MPDNWPCCMGDNITEEYIGWRCRVCGALYPSGCEPWAPVDDDLEDTNCESPELEASSQEDTC